MDALEYWRELSNRSRVEIEATCRAIGAAGYLLGPYCPYTDAERLTHLREVIAELRLAIGLDDPDTTSTATDTPNDRTNGRDS